MPHVTGLKESLPLIEYGQLAKALFDVYDANKSRLLQKLKEYSIIRLYMPGHYTDGLQPLDLAFNLEYKETLKKALPRVGL